MIVLPVPGTGVTKTTSSARVGSPVVQLLLLAQIAESLPSQRIWAKLLGALTSVITAAKKAAELLEVRLDFIGSKEYWKVRAGTRKDFFRFWPI